MLANAEPKTPTPVHVKPPSTAHDSLSAGETAGARLQAVRLTKLDPPSQAALPIFTAQATFCTPSLRGGNEALYTLMFSGGAHSVWL